MARSKWLSKFRQGSFRGIPFFIERHQLQGGRRKIDREFATREIGNSEDVGKKLKNYQLTLYILGDDYFSDRDALLKALDAEGSGELVHPYLGNKTVQVGGYAMSETVEEGRMARFSVEFSEAGQIRFPDQFEDDLSNTITRALAAIESAKESFAEVLSVANQPAFVVQAAADGIGAVADFMEDAVKSVTEPIANMTFAVRNLKAEANDLAKLPGELANRIAGLFETLQDELDGDEETSSRVLGAFSDVDDSFEVVIGDTPSRNQERINQNALINFTKQVAALSNAQEIVEIDFLSTDAAILKQTEVLEELDLQLEVVTDDQLFQDIKDVQTSISRALPRVGTSELIEITPVQTLPALVIAYENFEDLDKEDEIVEQNNIEHPGFVPGGDPIQVSAS